MKDIIQAKTPHNWVPDIGYDASDICSYCRVNVYATNTKFCEDVAAEKQERLEKKERRHAPTEAAWNRARSVLTKEEWDLMELQSKHNREYRIIDYIKV